MNPTGGSLAVITARGGSKRIPRKNVKLFAGKPAVAWAVEAAINSGLFDSVVISTDDDEIAETACKFGASRPFVRPPELADDHAGTLDVMRHAVLTVGQGYKSCCCLYGTSVFATPALLAEGKGLLSVEAVMCAVRFEHPPQRGFYIDDGKCDFISRTDFASRTQDLRVVYHDVGLFYWFDTDALLDDTKKSLADFEVAPLILPRGVVVDIDTEDDWSEAEKIMYKLRES